MTLTATAVGSQNRWSTRQRSVSLRDRPATSSLARKLMLSPLNFYVFRPRSCSPHLARESASEIAGYQQ